MAKWSEVRFATHVHPYTPLYTPIHPYTHAPQPRAVHERSTSGPIPVSADCVISHGAAASLRERLFEQSDAFVCAVCSKCGFLCHSGSRAHVVRGVGAFCAQCKTGEHVTKVAMPFATKLLISELQALNFAPTLRLTKGGAADPAARSDIATVG